MNLSHIVINSAPETGKKNPLTLSVGVALHERSYGVVRLVAQALDTAQRDFKTFRIALRQSPYEHSRVRAVLSLYRDLVKAEFHYWKVIENGGNGSPSSLFRGLRKLTLKGIVVDKDRDTEVLRDFVTMYRDPDYMPSSFDFSPHLKELRVRLDTELVDLLTLQLRDLDAGETFPNLGLLESRNVKAGAEILVTFDFAWLQP